MSPPPDQALDGRVHRFPVRVYYEDTDAGGVVYHANYLKFIERARTEMMRSLGVEHTALDAAAGVRFAVRRLEIGFARPARLDDRLEIRTVITKMTGAILTLVQEVWTHGDHLARAEVQVFCLNRAGRPVRLPPSLRDRLIALAGPAPAR